MAQYVRMHLGNGTYQGTRLVTAGNLNVTKTPHINIGGVGDSLTHFSGYGLGWVVQDYRGRRIAWHNDGAETFVTFQVGRDGRVARVDIDGLGSFTPRR